MLQLPECLLKKGTSFTITLGDFNARSTTWWYGDITITEGANIEASTSYHEFEQVINEPTRIIPNSASCIDFVFPDKPNLIIENGVFPFLCVKCHHQIVYSNLNLNVVYPSPYQCFIWDYKKGDLWIQLIGDFVLFDKNVHQQDQVQYLHEIIMNIFYNYLSNKCITIDDKEPPWMNDEIKNKINYRNTVKEI